VGPRWDGLVFVHANVLIYLTFVARLRIVWLGSEPPGADSTCSKGTLGMQAALCCAEMHIFCLEYDMD
jgi:hypothetical protein